MRTAKSLLSFFVELLVVLTFARPTPCQNAVPMLINYEGELKSPRTGDPVQDGNYDMVFEIFTATTGGVSVWQGSYTSASRNPVEVKDGRFNIILGSESGNAMGASVFDGSDRWLEIRVGTETLLPRQRITSSAYSLMSENSRLLGGKESSEYVIQAQGLQLQATATSPNIIAGYTGNAVTAGVVGATIGGGGASGNANLVTDNYGTIGGGGDNQAGNNAGTTEDAEYATVGGGLSNTASGTYATVGGGFSNTAGESGSTVGGGWDNTASGGFATVGGGYLNETSQSYAAVGGGATNSASGTYATIGGGLSNSASGTYATVGGGTGNTASRYYATVGGGASNTASGLHATVPGGDSNWAAGDYSFTAGHNTIAYGKGSFVWGDSTDTHAAVAVADNQFMARCSGGVVFFTSSNISTGVFLTPGSGSWSESSDRALKDNVMPVDGKDVLSRLMAMPMAEWNYKAQDASIRHMGPIAQDFYEAFGLGEDDKHITTVDADGVALAAIQGLHEIVREKESRISTLEHRNADLEERLEALESLVSKLTDRQEQQEDGE